MTKELTEDQFDEQYKSLDGPDGSMIWEHDDVKDIPLNRVWTVVDGDEGQQCAMPGKHIVNKVGYLVTERPYTSDDITVTLSSTDDGYLDNDHANSQTNH